MLRDRLQEVVNKVHGLEELISRTESLLAQLEANSHAIVNDPVALKKMESGKEVAQEKMRVAWEQVQEHYTLLMQHDVRWDADTGVIQMVGIMHPQPEEGDLPEDAADDSGAGSLEEDGGTGAGHEVQEQQEEQAGSKSSNGYGLEPSSSGSHSNGNGVVSVSLGVQSNGHVNGRVAYQVNQYSQL